MQGLEYTEKGWRLPTQHSMLRRSIGHDYHAPATYMITLTTSWRLPQLGELIADEDKPRIQLSPLGKMVADCIEQIPVRHPLVEILQKMIMPDHVHLILRVRDRLTRGIGDVIAGMKYGCQKGYSQAIFASTLERENSQAVLASTLEDRGLASSTCEHDKATTVCNRMAVADEDVETEMPEKLFTAGYCDRIIYNAEQLQKEIAYLKDNPRRLMIKRQNRQYFKIIRDLEMKGKRFDAIGNLQLLHCPMAAVHVRSKWNEKEVRSYQETLIAENKGGKVVIGAFISQAEKVIRNTAIEQGLPLIIIQENGFPELYKPGGVLFDVCADGRLLILAPWQYHSDRRKIARWQCVAMNEMAEAIAGEM